VISIKLTDPTLDVLLHKLYNIFSVIMSMYILEYHYDKLCWYDIFHVFKENEFLKEKWVSKENKIDMIICDMWKVCKRWESSG
jgi:hypothetical protein